MKIISLSNGHDASITAIEDGKLIQHWELERVLNIKHFCGVDHSDEITGVLLKHVLPRLGWKVTDIDLLVFAGKSEWKKTSFAGQVPQYDEANLDKPWAEGSVIIDNHTIKAYAITHHVNHLASAYYTSPFTQSMLYSLDGLGDRTSGMAGYALKNKLYIQYSHFHKPLTQNNGIGLYYSYLGDIFPFLGTDLLAAAGKAMGLSSYGTIRKEWLEECKNALLQWMPQRPLQLPEKLNINRADLKDPMNKVCQDLMATIQESLELYILDSIRTLSKNIWDNKNIHVYDREDIRSNLCIAGGCALNVQANSRLLDEDTIANLYAPPAISDCGISIGAGLYVWHHILDNSFEGMKWHNPYLGDTIYFDIHGDVSLHCDFKEEHELQQFIVDKLAEGKIIGWAHGQCEIGPRALMNRSILANPMIANMKDIVNEKVKHREFWRPFAGVMLEEDVQNYFEVDHPTPYMLESPYAKPGVKDLIPAIIHADNTCRIQTINENQNLIVYQLLKKFKEKTGHGIILNTSLNDRGRPIANCVSDILNLVRDTELDYAVINNWVFSKK